MKKAEIESLNIEFQDETKIVQFQHEFLKLLKKIEENTRK